MDLERYLQAVRDAAEEWAQAKSNLVFLEHYRRALLAKLMKDSGEKSAAAQERDALASEMYGAHLEALREAVKEEAVMHWTLKRAEMKVELWRTQQATARLERKAYNA